METPLNTFTVADALKSCEDARNISIGKMNSEASFLAKSLHADYEARTFPAGKVVKLAGFPVKCTTEVTIEAHPGTWEMIDSWEAESSQSPVECGSAQGGGHLVCAGKTDCQIG